MKLTTAGESHGRALVGIIEGLPANLGIDVSLINADLALRQSGYGRGGRQKIESDRIEVLSGVRRILVKNPAPKKVTADSTSPTRNEKNRAPRKTRWALRYSPRAFLADICLATASGML